MTRIIAGAAGGRRLQVPDGQLTRPTSDRVREALFSRLEHQGWLDGTRVLDLYAGSGALGLEALSRGAREAVLVEHGPAVARLLQKNAASTGLSGSAVVVDKVERFLAKPAAAAFDLVLLDPPYPSTEPAITRVLALLADGGWLRPHAALVVEREGRSPEPTWPDGVTGAGDRAYGSTRLWFAETGSAPAS